MSEDVLSDLMSQEGVLAKHFVGRVRALEENKLALEARLSKTEEQLRDIPGVDLQAKISVLRLWAEPEMERRTEALAEESDNDVG